MSFWEILVIITVALLVIKPEDVPKIVSKVKEIRASLAKAKKDMISYFDFDKDNIKDNGGKTNKIEKNLEDEVEQMNFYLEKIASLNAEYQGEYDLGSVKEYYRKLMNQRISSEIAGQKQNESDKI